MAMVIAERIKGKLKFGDFFTEIFSLFLFLWVKLIT